VLLSKVAQTVTRELSHYRSRYSSKQIKLKEAALTGFGSSLCAPPHKLVSLDSSSARPMPCPSEKIPTAPVRAQSARSLAGPMAADLQPPTSPAQCSVSPCAPAGSPNLSDGGGPYDFNRSNKSALPCEQPSCPITLARKNRLRLESCRTELCQGCVR